jgi:alpha-galactosidase
VWSYPQPEDDAEAVAFNMINAILLRVHQAGKLDKLSPEQLGLVKAGLDYYKSIRGQVKASIPFWPLGLPVIGDGWACLGLQVGERAFVGVWRLGSEEGKQALCLPQWKGKNVAVRCAYPPGAEAAFGWDSETAALTVQLPQAYSARLYEVQG